LLPVNQSPEIASSIPQRVKELLGVQGMLLNVFLIKDAIIRNEPSLPEGIYISASISRNQVTTILVKVLKIQIF